MKKMKTNNVFLFAAFLAVTLVFASCSSDEDLVGKEETNQERGVVKTEFTISFPQKVGKTTRMSEAIVQGQLDNTSAQAPDFRGIQDIKFYAFTTAVGSISSSTAYTQPIILRGGTVAAFGASGTSPNTIASSGALYSNSNSHLYKDVEIPIGTQTFMFYGQAARESGATEFTDGILTTPFDGSTTLSTLANITFAPAPITSETGPSSNGVAVVRYLNAIASAADATDATKKWSTNTTSIKLRNLYDTFITINTGSWASVKAAVQQLYTSVNTISTDIAALSETTAAETETKTVADAVMNAIINTTIESTGSDKFVTEVSDGTLTFAELGNFPADLRLPDGAAQVRWNTESNPNAFEPVTATGLTGMNVAAYTKYAYPAALWYRALSPIYVAEESKLSKYNDTDSWATILTGYKKSNDTYDQVVTSKTRSIAMVDQAQYAVGRLDVTIKVSSWSVKDLAGTSFEVGGNNLQLTGVLIGGQEKVDYEFKPTFTDAPKYTIYDKDIYYIDANEPNVRKNIYLTTSVSKKNYTLVLETPAVTNFDDEDDQRVAIALEFLNNTDKIIVGQSNCLIYPNTKFYLVGYLKPNKDKSLTAESPIKQAFLQDHITTANFTIESLQSAYNVLPDLTLPSLELGLSVDLIWQEGITQGITIN